MKRFTLNILILLATLSPLFLSSCHQEPAEAEIVLETNFTGLADAIRNGGLSLSEKLSLIEASVAKGFTDGAAARQLLQQAVASLSGTAEEKLAAIEAAVSSQTASLELKLGLIEAAISGGFAAESAQIALIKAAISSLSGTTDEILAQVEAALTAQTTSIASRLSLLEAAVQDGLIGDKDAQDTIWGIIEKLGATAEERLQAIAQLVGSQSASLAAKLDLIDAALASKLAGIQDALSLIDQALKTLDGSIEEKLAAVETAIQNQLTGLSSKLSLIEAAVTGGFAGGSTQQDLIVKAIETLGGTLETRLAAVQTELDNQQNSLSSKLELIEAAVTAGLADAKGGQELIRTTLSSLAGTVDEKMAAIKNVIDDQTTSLSSKLAAIEVAVSEGFASEEEGMKLIRAALDALKGTSEEKLGNIEAAVTSGTTSLSTKLTAIKGTVADSLANANEALELILEAVASLKKSVDGADPTQTTAITSVMSLLESIQGTMEGQLYNVLSSIFSSIDGQKDYSQILAGIENVIKDLDAPITIQFEDLVTDDVLIMGCDTLLRIPYTLPDATVKLEATASAGIIVSVEPLQNNPLQGFIVIGAMSIDDSSTVELTLSNQFKSEKHTLKIVEAVMSMSPGQDKTLFYDETGQMEFHYSTNTPVTITIPQKATWLHRVYDPEKQAAASDSVFFLVADPNYGFYERQAIVSITNQVSKNILSFVIHQDYNSTKINFDINNQSLASAFVKDTLHINFNKDGFISMAEAAAVTSLEALFGNSLTQGANYNSFDEFQYFTGIETIPAGSFHNWNNLTSITLPSSIKTIHGGYGEEDGPFTNCPKLESIKGTFPANSKVQVYDNQILVYDKKLLKAVETATSVTIPGNVEIIGSKAFYKSNVTDITIPSAVKTIRDHAFEYSQIQTVTFINTHVDSLAENSFSHCFKLKSFDGPKSGTYTIRVTPDRLCLCRDTTLYAFAMGSGLTEYAIPESAGIRRLAANVFSAEASNSSGADPSAVQWQMIGLPSTLNDIGDHAFEAQSVNMEVWFKGVNPPKSVAGAFDVSPSLQFLVPAVKSGFSIDLDATNQRLGQFRDALEDHISTFDYYTEWPFAEGVLVVATIAKKSQYFCEGNPNGNLWATWLVNEHIAVLYQVGEEKKRSDARIVSVSGGEATIYFYVDESLLDVPQTACTLIYPLSAANDQNTAPKQYSEMAGTQTGFSYTCLDVHVGSGTINSTDKLSLTVNSHLEPIYSIFLISLSSWVQDVDIYYADNHTDCLCQIHQDSLFGSFYVAVPAGNKKDYYIDCAPTGLCGGLSVPTSSAYSLPTPSGYIFDFSVNLSPKN